MMSEINLYEILVPCQWNDGTPIRTKHHKAWDEKARAVSGGLTVYSPVKGQWVNGDQLFLIELFQLGFSALRSKWPKSWT